MAVVAIGSRAEGRATPGSADEGGDPLPPAARDAIALAAHGLGGAARLVDWVNADPANEKTFWGTIFPKLLSYQDGDGGGAGEVIDEIRWTIVDPIGGADGGA